MFTAFTFQDLKDKIYSYRGSLPYATFGTGKNSHKPKIALGKYLANAIFGQFISLLQFDFGFWAILFH